MSDHNKVHQIILERLKAAKGAFAIDRLFSAWSDTRNLRENGGCSDENLAIAEHYLYARYYVADNGFTGWAYMQALITGYEGIKMFGGKGLLPETGKCKVTPFDPKAALWALDGTDDGLSDYRKGSKSAVELKPPKLRS
jgi:hypothetical protein